MDLIRVVNLEVVPSYSASQRVVATFDVVLMDEITIHDFILHFDHKKNIYYVVYPRHNPIRTFVKGQVVDSNTVLTMRRGILDTLLKSVLAAYEARIAKSNMDSHYDGASVIDIDAVTEVLGVREYYLWDDVVAVIGESAAESAVTDGTFDYRDGLLFFRHQEEA